MKTNQKFLLFLLFLTTLSLRSQTFCFSPDNASTYTMSANGNNMAIASDDLNGDGNADLLSGWMDSLFVKFGNGSGGFGSTAKYLINQQPRDIHVADLNGDGKKDVAVTGANVNKISVLINNGSGALLPYSTYNVGSYPIDITSSDFNSDGKTDLAVLNFSSDNVSLLFNSGSGNFNPAVNFSCSSAPETLVNMDANNDGKNDLVIVNNSNTLSVLLGNGSGSFTPSSYPISHSASRVLSRDLDGNGKNDLIVAGFSDNYLTVLMNDGIVSTTSFSEFSYLLPFTSVDITYGEFTGDAIPDVGVIVNASAPSYQLTVLKGLGSGMFDAGAVNFNFMPVNHSGGIAADFNNDGQADIALKNAIGGHVGITLNSTYNVSVTPDNYAICSGNSVMITASVNGMSSYNWSTGSTSAAIFESPSVTTTYSLEASSYSCYDTAQVTITVSTPPTLSMFSPSSFCEDMVSQPVSANITGGTGPFNFSISSDAGLNFMPSAGTESGTMINTIISGTAGSYQATLTVSDAIGCTGQNTTIISIYPTPSIAFSGPSIVCPNSTTTISATGADTYYWSTTDITPDIAVTPTAYTEYTVTGTSMYGCVSTAVYSLSVYAASTFSILSSASAGCENTVFDFTITPNGTYTMSPGGTTGDLFSVSPSVTTTYTFETTDLNGCYVADYSTITIYPKPVAAGNSNSPICEGKNLFLNDMSTISSGTIINYVWSGPGGYTSTLNNSFISAATTTMSGMYSLSVSSDMGCMDITTINVTVNPIPNVTIAQPSQTVCAGTTLTLTASGADDYSWSTTETTASIVVSPTVTTFYDVIGSYSLTGCGNNANITIATNPSQDIGGLVTSTVGASSGDVILYKYSAILTKWDSVTTVPYSSSYNFTAVDSGLYVVKAVPSATNELITYGNSSISWQSATIVTHGCTNAASHNISIIGLDNIGAGTGIIQGFVYEGNSFGNKWSGAPLSPQAPGNPIGGIIVKGGKNPGGTMFAQTTTDASGGYTLTNVPDNLPGENYFLLVDIPGLDTSSTYHIILTSGNNNFQDLNFYVDSVKIYPMTTTGINNAMMAENYSINLYPNPTNNTTYLTYTLNKTALVKLELLNMMGECVTIITPADLKTAGSHKERFNIEKLPPGIYFINLSINGESSYIKLQVTE